MAARQKVTKSRTIRIKFKTPTKKVKTGQRTTANKVYIKKPKIHWHATVDCCVHSRHYD